MSDDILLDIFDELVALKQAIQALGLTLTNIEQSAAIIIDKLSEKKEKGET